MSNSIINKEADFESSMLNQGTFDFAIKIRGRCKAEDLKKIQSLFNRYLKLIEGESESPAGGK